jgi:hypothetical protein
LSENSRVTVPLSLVEYGFWRNANRDIIGLRSTIAFAIGTISRPMSVHSGTKSSIH